MKSSEHKQFRCTYPGCDKVFNRRDYLERHATNHLSVKPYVCVLCNRHFSRKDLYDNHLTTKRHARVSHEAEQANYDHQLGQISQRAVLEDRRNTNTFQPTAQSQKPSMVSDITLDSGFADQGPSSIAVYAPPTRQPLYLSGPGPGPNQYSSTDISVPRNDYLTSHGAISGQIQENDGSQFHADPYHSFCDTNSKSGIESMASFDSQRDEIGWHTLSKNTLSVGGSYHAGRFSAYGVTLGLDSSSASSRSETSISDDYNSDVDLQNPTGTINERIRRDMSSNPHPFINLREQPPKDAPSEDVNTLSEVDLLQEQHFSNQELEAYNDRSEPSQDDSIPAANIKSAEEAIGKIVSDKRYAWFFDNAFNTEKAKLGYDRCYSDSVEIYQARSEGYSRGSVDQGSFDVYSNEKKGYSDATADLGNKMMDVEIASETSRSSSSVQFADAMNNGRSDLPKRLMTLTPERSSRVLSILREAATDNDLTVVTKWIEDAWNGADAVKHIIHPSTFDPNATNVALLSVLALIGMALSGDQEVANSARRAYASVFLCAYESLVQLPSSGMPGRLDLNTVSKLQAFCLLLRYERLILMGDATRLSFTRNPPGKYVTDLFLGKALAAVPRVGYFSAPKRQQPIWATMSTEGYMFHQGADPLAQWKEWILIESTKRTVHFALYCDCIVSLANPKPNPVSIFQMDLHMICPESLWLASSAEEFFYICGPSGILINVPYLGLIKSLIRFPRSAQGTDLIPSKQAAEVRSRWSIFALKSVAHGLITIVGKLTGLVTHADEMLKAVLQSRTDPEHSNHIFNKFDRQLQARLYRGLDIWYHYFSSAYGDVTDQIMQTTGSVSIPLRDDFDMAQSGDEGGVPQYALIIFLCHYSSFIFVHEDLPVVLQVTANLKSWLETQEDKSLQLLLDYLYLPLYSNWIKTDEAKGIVRASSLYLVWFHAVTGTINSGNHMFLSAMIYIATVVIWLYDFANYDISPADGAAAESDEERGKQRSRVRLENFQFMDDAIDYIHEVYNHVSGQGPPPRHRAINSVLLLCACLMHRRKSTKLLVEMVLQLLVVMDSEHSKQELMTAVKNSSQVYEARVSKAQEILRRRNEDAKMTSDGGDFQRDERKLESDLATMIDLEDASIGVATAG